MMITRAQLKILLGFSIGAGLGASVTYRVAKTKFEAELQKEIQDVKDNYRLLRKDDYETPTDFVAKNRPDEIVDVHLATLEIEKHAQLNAEMTELVEPYRNESVFNAFQAPVADAERLPDDANETLFEQLKAMRSSENPYLVSVAEYHDEVSHFEKVTVTYFAGDNVIAYEDDHIMLDPDDTIGLINLSRFGVMSDDASFVYVRNEKIHTDFEIVRDEGKYSEMMARINGTYDDGDDGD